LERIGKHFLSICSNENFVFLYFISNGSCVNAEKSQIVSGIETNRVSIIHGENEQGNLYRNILLLFEIFFYGIRFS